MSPLFNEILDAREKRARTLNDHIRAAREAVRTRLSPESSQEDRDLYEKLNAALYILNGDPFDMHMRAALSHEEQQRPALILGIAEFHIDDLAEHLCRSKNEEPQGTQVSFNHDGMHSITFHEMAKRDVRVVVEKLARLTRPASATEAQRAKTA